MWVMDMNCFRCAFTLYRGVIYVCFLKCISLFPQFSNLETLSKCRYLDWRRNNPRLSKLKSSLWMQRWSSAVRLGFLSTTSFCLSLCLIVHPTQKVSINPFPLHSVGHEHRSIHLKTKLKRDEQSCCNKKWSIPSETWLIIFLEVC